MAIYDYSKLSLSELIQKIGNSRYWNLPKMLEEALKRLKALIDTNEPTYKVYTALLTQTGTEAPVATVLENTIGDITFAYNSIGSYLAISDGLFTENKTVAILPASDASGQIGAVAIDVNQVYMFAFGYVQISPTESIWEYANDKIQPLTYFEIRVYN